MRVAFPFFSRVRWTGGYNYLLNLFRVITTYEEGRVVPVVFVGDDVDETELQPFVAGGIEVVRSELFREDRRAGRLLLALLTGRDPGVEELFRVRRIDMVFEVATYYGARFKLPALAWMPDFQHRHLPEMFGRLAWLKRELGFRAQVHGGRVVMLSSEEARQDCERFYPKSRGRTCVVPFAVRIDHQLLAQEPESVRLRYGLPAGFFLLPNQFWKHKNHRLVIEALALIPGRNIVVAATGNPSDPRHQGLDGQLRQLVDRNGLGHAFRFLGMVPYADVIGLMRSARAIINPSLFEGWSSTVEEARALGVPLLLSELPVHREQMGANASYFPADSPNLCARALQTFADRPIPEVRQREQEAAARLVGRERAFAECFRQLVMRTVATRAGGGTAP